jgi:inner membrane protein
VSPPTFWHWWILAGLCLLAEALAPGFVFLWFGLSAGLTGLAVLAAPGLAWQAQLLAFSALAVASVALWLRRRRPRPEPGAGVLNRRAEACVGSPAVVETPLSAGRRGRVRLGDTTWAATGPDLPAGAEVRVTGARGAVLVVEPAGVPDRPG